MKQAWILMLLCAAATAASAVAAQASNELPDMGNPVDAILTRGDEYRIGITVLRETVAARNSSGGKFVSIRLSFEAADRERYEAAHAALRTDPDIKWTL